MPDEGTDDEQVEEAAREVASLDSLLPGEAAAMRSRHRDDAQHWLAVYEELFAFKQALLATLEDQRGRVRQEGVHEVQNDEIVLTREAERLSRRLEYWQQQLGDRS